MELDLGKAIEGAFGTECNLARAISAKNTVKKQLEQYVDEVAQFFEERTDNIALKHTMKLKTSDDSSSIKPFLSLSCSANSITSALITFYPNEDMIKFNKLIDGDIVNEYILTYEELQECLLFAIETTSKTMQENTRALLGEYLQEKYSKANEPEQQSPDVL